jgi:hypothetical protein
VTRQAFVVRIVSFDGAVFSGDAATFGHAVVSGSQVFFNSVTGPAPDGLLAAVGTPVPATVTCLRSGLPLEP